MHVLIIPSWYSNTYNPLSGIFFKEQAEALAKYRQTGVIAIQEISVKDLFKQKKLDFSNNYFIENNVHTYSVQYPAIPKLHKIRRKIKLNLFSRLFKKYIQKHGLPDIIHLHSYIAGELAMYVKERYNIPYIVTEHSSAFARGLVSKSDMQLARQVFINSDSNIAVSNELKKLLQNRFNVEFQYVPNIVNINFFNPVQKNNGDIFKFINIAFLEKNKNQSMLIKSFAKVFKNNNQATLTIVGDGPEYNELINLVNELGMQKQIFLHGRADRNEVKKLLQQSDAFVLSSKYETFGVVAIEAMACGLPVVSTKCGGPESIITSEKVGLLSDIDEKQLSIKLLEMYNNRLNFNSMHIRQHIQSNFSEQIVLDRLLSIYSHITETS